MNGILEEDLEIAEKFMNLASIFTTKDLGKTPEFVLTFLGRELDI